MDFNDLSRLFRNTVIGILDSEHQIEEEHVKEVSNILNKFARLQLKDHEIKLFLDDVLRYFVLLNQYTNQFDVISASQQCTIRMGLGVFLFVLDSTHIYEKIFRKFQKIIDVLTESNPHNVNIKEFLRIYSHLLDKTSIDVLKNLANKQKSLTIWYKIMKNTGDIETQAIIIEVVVKLFKCNNYINIDETFFELVQVTDVSSIDKLNMYPNIRIILDQYNEYSSNIFSVNCSAIKLDSRRVVEFNGVVNDIWLDLNLLQNRLSFFCDQNFAASKVKMYPTSTSWEVLSFYAKDIVNQIFNYNSVTESLEMSLLISASNINLLARANASAVHKIEIFVCRDSDRFYQLLVNLSKMFPKSFSVEALGIPSKKELDSSRTPDISQVGSGDSSPIIEHFEMRKKVSGRDENSSFFALSEAYEDSVIVISDDENEPPVPPSESSKNQDFNILKLTKDKSKCCSVINNTVPSKEATHYKENKIEVVNKKTKKTAFFKRLNTSNVFNKSVSPVSFTESVFGRRSRSHSRNSEMIQNGNVTKATKISTTKKVDRKEKISTVKAKPGMKISSSLSSAIIKPHKELVIDKRDQEKVKNITGELAIEERMMDATYVDVDLNASITKVENWLKSVEKEAPLSLDDVEYVAPKMPESENLLNSQDVLPSVSERDSTVAKKLPENEDLPDGLPSISERGSGMHPKQPQNEDLPDVLPSVSERDSSMAPEEKIKLMMGHEESLDADQEKTKVNSVACENTVEDLLDILCSQGSKGAQNVENACKDEKQNSISKNDAPSQDSNVSLSKTTKLWKGNLEAISTSADKIEVAKDYCQKVTNQSLAVIKDTENMTSETIIEQNVAISSHVEHIDDGPDTTEKITDQNLPKINNIEVVEEVSKSPAITTHVENIDVENRKKRTVQNRAKANHENELDDDDDRTPDLEEFFPKKNSLAKKGISVNNNLNNTLDNVSVQPEVKITRKLYNPGDLSYLNTSLTDYLQSTKKTTKTPTVIPEIIHISSRSSRSKGVKKSTTKNGKENKNSRRKHSTENKSTKNIVRNGAIKKNAQAVGMTKSLNALKETFRQQKKRIKMEKKLKYKKTPKSSSSSSSMEPFGVALKNLRKEKRKPLTFAENIPAKRLKEETPSSAKENKNENRNKKIHIISDVLIQPASVRPVIEHNSSEKCCCPKLVRMTSEFYLEFIMQISKANPSLLSGDMHSTIIKILKGCGKS